MAVFAAGLIALQGTARAQEATPDLPAAVAEFHGEAPASDCKFIPEKPFTTTAAMNEPHTLSISCRKADRPNRRDLAMNFLLIGPAQGDHEFRWGADPASPHAHPGLFTHQKKRCLEVMKAFRSSLPPEVAVAPPQNPPLEARWRAECAPEDQWGTVLIVHLNVAPKEQEPAS